MGITLDEVILDASTSSIAIGDGTDTLEVNADGSINAVVSATDLDIRDLDATQDNVAISDGTDTLEVNADGSINATVSATDLDIRDLVNTQDSVAIGDEVDIIDLQLMDSPFDATPQGIAIMGIRQDAGGSPVSATGDAHPLVFNADGELKVAADLNSDVGDDDVDSGNPVKMGGRGVDGASALTALSASNDRYDLLGDLYRRTWVNKSANVGILNSAATVGTTAAEVLASPLAGRQTVTIQNNGTAAVYVGSSAGVTTANGLRIPRRSSATYDFGEAIDIFMISGSAGQDVRFIEVA